MTAPDVPPVRFPLESDEGRHPASPVECWWFWGRAADASAAVFVGLELRGRRFDYWAGVARVGSPYLYVEELDGTGLRGGLEIKPPEMWADHQCDVPLVQWSLGTEAHGVLLDDPGAAMRRPFGDRVPMTVDVEWYATGAAAETETGIAGARGYGQRGEIDARIELLEGIVTIEGPAHRLHWWGVPWRPAVDAPLSGRLRAPLRRADGTGVDQMVGPDGWTARSVR